MTAIEQETTHHDQLRAWARGIYTTEAGTELLIRAFGGRFAAPGKPWIHGSDDAPYIEFSEIPDFIGGLSGGEHRFLLLAASVGDGHIEVDLGDIMPGLDFALQDLVLEALRHAGGRRGAWAPTS